MGRFTNSVKREKLIPGDHIYTWRKGLFYAHHGIYVGDDKVIQFTSKGKLGSISSSSFQNSNGVVCSTLDNFLDGGKLYLYKYSVSKARFFTRVLGGTCTLAHSDDADVVIHRARYLLDNGFGCYDLLTNNCENFAVYCKTGLAVQKNRTAGHCGQISNTAVSISSMFIRYESDIGVRQDVVRVPVEEIANFMSK